MKRKTNKEPEPRSTIRCAIYTRKSTNEGLDQDFNSLDAQREAGENFIASQREEGWLCLPDRYDDGGFSGGDMERPALKRLLDDIEAGKVDCIVVYKVDRLSRSLLDFTRLMETLDHHNVSFVSVTQQFNTTHSMGRLTLNILLSFAQFEREIISERTRDKIAATRRKGKWTGGVPMLGYDVAPEGGKLLVNEAEAAQVRTAFELYLKHQALIATIKELDARGWTTKSWTTRKGRERVGRPFTKSSLFKLLTNVIYLGKITLGREMFEGEHPAIVDAEIFRRAQALLRRNGRSGGKHVRGQFGALLKNLVHCVPCDCSMVHNHTTRKTNGATKRYRYYVCQTAQKRGWHNCPSKSVPAAELEKFVIDQIRCIGKDSALLAETIRQTHAQGQKQVAELDAEKKRLELELIRLDAKLRRLASKAGETDETTDEMAELQERIQADERRATELREGIIALSRQLVDERELASALSLFDPVWDTLAPREQRRVLQLLIERVDYDGEKSTVSVTFHPAGIKTLADELNEENGE